MPTTQPPATHTALVLTGGGARGAYQAGVLKALGEILAAAQSPNNGRTFPFAVLSGASAGAINTCYLAAQAQDFSQSTQDLATLWQRMESDLVFRSDLATLGKTCATWASDLVFGGMKSTTGIKSLLRTDPLAKLLGEVIDFENIDRHLKSGLLDAVEVTCTDYSSSYGTSFVQTANPRRLWQRARRHGVAASLTLDHLLASSAIPIFFPPQKIQDVYFGDGCLRNTAPLSPAIHLGATRILAVSTQHRSDSLASMTEIRSAIKPTVARILGVMMSAILLDAISLDLERIERINHTVSLIPPEQRHQTNLKQIAAMVLRPRQDIGKIAKEYVTSLPKSIRYLMEGLGSQEESAELLSYLIFAPDYCSLLVDLGYQDTNARAQELCEFLQPPPPLHQEIPPNNRVLSLQRHKDKKE
jgi:NTE family protein